MYQSPVVDTACKFAHQRSNFIEIRVHALKGHICGVILKVEQAKLSVTFYAIWNLYYSAGISSTADSSSSIWVLIGCSVPRRTEKKNGVNALL